MTIKINDIPPEGLTLELAHKLDLFDKGTASTMFVAVLSFKPSGAGLLHVTGRIQAEPLLECSRCLRSFPYKIDAEVSVELAPASTVESSTEHELDRSELDTEFYHGEEIEPAAIIKEQLLIAVPMVPLHDMNCKGLCPVCGKDLNEAGCDCNRDDQGSFGAFSALKDIFKK
jgi:uncharacterized protein